MQVQRQLGREIGKQIMHVAHLQRRRLREARAGAPLPEALLRDIAAQDVADSEVGRGRQIHQREH